MHELSLACSVVELVEKELALHGGGSVRCIEITFYFHRIWFWREVRLPVLG